MIQSSPFTIKGTFIRKNGIIFRPEAYIQFGQSTQPLGTVIMQNPGSATLEEPFPDNQQVTGTIQIDPTMKQLIEIVQEAYMPQEPQGRIYIYNLFPLRNGKAKESLEQFEQLWKMQEPLVTQLPRSRHELVQLVKDSNWVLFGWGCADKTVPLKAIIRDWYDIVAQTGTTIVGKRGKTPNDYYHPRPQLVSSQQEYKALIVRQLKELLEVPAEMTDESWKRHVQFYEPLNVIETGKYTVKLYTPYENGRAINYLYRLFIFPKQQTSPSLALNFEQSYAGTHCLAVTLTDMRLNLGPAPDTMTPIQFIDWAKGVIPAYIQDLDVRLLNALKQPREDERPKDELSKRRLQHFIKQVRQFNDRLEYVIVEDYENKTFDEIHAIMLQGINFIFTEHQEVLRLVSIEMYNATFEQFYAWLQKHAIYLSEAGESHVIEGYTALLDGVQFKGNLIVLYTRGANTTKIEPSNYPEITENWDPTLTLVNQDKIIHTQAIFINGQAVETFEPLYFDLEKDIIISNGQQINAHKIQLSNNFLSFYHPNLEMPIAQVATNETVISILIHPSEEGRFICVIDFSYDIKI